MPTIATVTISSTSVKPRERRPKARGVPVGALRPTGDSLSAGQRLDQDHMGGRRVRRTVEHQRDHVADVDRGDALGGQRAGTDRVLVPVDADRRIAGDRGHVPDDLGLPGRAGGRGPEGGRGREDRQRKSGVPEAMHVTHHRISCHGPCAMVSCSAQPGMQLVEFVVVTQVPAVPPVVFSPAPRVVYATAPPAPVISLGAEAYDVPSDTPPTVLPIYMSALVTVEFPFQSNCWTTVAPPVA